MHPIGDKLVNFCVSVSFLLLVLFINSKFYETDQAQNLPVLSPHTVKFLDKFDDPISIPISGGKVIIQCECRQNDDQVHLVNSTGTKISDSKQCGNNEVVDLDTPIKDNTVAEPIRCKGKDGVSGNEYRLPFAICDDEDGLCQRSSKCSGFCFIQNVTKVECDRLLPSMCKIPDSGFVFCEGGARSFCDALAHYGNKSVAAYSPNCDNTNVAEKNVHLKYGDNEQPLLYYQPIVVKKGGQIFVNSDAAGSSLVTRASYNCKFKEKGNAEAVYSHEGASFPHSFDVPESLFEKGPRELKMDCTLEKDSAKVHLVARLVIFDDSSIVKIDKVRSPKSTAIMHLNCSLDKDVHAPFRVHYQWKYNGKVVGENQILTDLQVGEIECDARVIYKSCGPHQSFTHTVKVEKIKITQDEKDLSDRYSTTFVTPMSLLYASVTTAMENLSSTVSWLVTSLVSIATTIGNWYENLSAGAKAGFWIGILLVVGLILGIAFLIWWKTRGGASSITVHAKPKTVDTIPKTKDTKPKTGDTNPNLGGAASNVTTGDQVVLDQLVGPADSVEKSTEFHNEIKEDRSRKNKTEAQKAEIIKGVLGKLQTEEEALKNNPNKADTIEIFGQTRVIRKRNQVKKIERKLRDMCKFRDAKKRSLTVMSSPKPREGDGHLLHFFTEAVLAITGDDLDGSPLYAYYLPRVQDEIMDTKYFGLQCVGYVDKGKYYVCVIKMTQKATRKEHLLSLVHYTEWQDGTLLRDPRAFELFVDEIDKQYDIRIASEPHANGISIQSGTGLNRSAITVAYMLGRQCIDFRQKFNVKKIMQYVRFNRPGAWSRDPSEAFKLMQFLSGMLHIYYEQQMNKKTVGLAEVDEGRYEKFLPAEVYQTDEKKKQRWSSGPASFAASNKTKK